MDISKILDKNKNNVVVDHWIKVLQTHFLCNELEDYEALDTLESIQKCVYEDFIKYHYIDETTAIEPFNCATMYEKLLSYKIAYPDNNAVNWCFKRFLEDYVNYHIHVKNYYERADYSDIMFNSYDNIYVDQALIQYFFQHTHYHQHPLIKIYEAFRDVCKEINHAHCLLERDTLQDSMSGSLAQQSLDNLTEFALNYDIKLDKINDRNLDWPGFAISDNRLLSNNNYKTRLMNQLYLHQIELLKQESAFHLFSFFIRHPEKHSYISETVAPIIYFAEFLPDYELQLFHRHFTKEHIDVVSQYKNSSSGIYSSYIYRVFNPEIENNIIKSFAEKGALFDTLFVDTTINKNFTDSLSDFWIQEKNIHSDNTRQAVLEELIIINNHARLEHSLHDKKQVSTKKNKI